MATEQTYRVSGMSSDGDDSGGRDSSVFSGVTLRVAYFAWLAFLPFILTQFLTSPPGRRAEVVGRGSNKEALFDQRKIMSSQKDPG